MAAYLTLPARRDKMGEMVETMQMMADGLRLTVCGPDEGVAQVAGQR
jgi:hypothetical protein